MQRMLKLFSLFGLMALLLAACGGGTAATPTAAPAAAATAAPAAAEATKAPEATAAPAAAEATKAPEATAAPAAAGGAANCAVSGPKIDKLVFWTRSKDGDPDYASIKAVAEAYTKASGSPVELVTVPDADFKSKMSIAAPAGEGPDVYGPIAHDWIGEFAIQKIALEVPDSAIKEKDDIIPAALDAARVDGKLYALPLFVESVALIYNKAMVPTPPKTWDEFVKIAQDQTKGDVYGFGFPILEQYHAGAFFMGFGGYIFKYENGKFDTNDIGLNNDASVKAVEFLRDMYHKKQPALPEVAIDRANMHGAQEGMMEAGKLAMTINGPWREAPLKKAGIDYGVAKLPSLPDGKPMRPFLGVQVYGASAFSKNKDAALDFISFATCTTSAIEQYKGFIKVPVRTSAVQSPEVQANPNIPVWKAQADDGVPMPNIPAMSNVWKPWGDAMDAIIPPNTPDDQVKGLLDNAVTQIKTAIEQTK
ncbi:extracellular solute-binding protein [Kouleothrix sp.]|uniref:sugar ABC transporter substrate-binding protein n=1 Tax=Kouleothrix sp. TaxID=2779161 RepID=UPI00391C2E16